MVTITNSRAVEAVEEFVRRLDDLESRMNGVVNVLNRGTRILENLDHRIREIENLPIINLLKEGARNDDDETDSGHG